MSTGESADDRRTEVEHAFKVWVNRNPQGPGQLGSRGAILKGGPLVLKTAQFSTFGNKSTGEIKKRQLRLRSVKRLPNGTGWDFDNPDRGWFCENEEVDRLVAFLGTEVENTGSYRLLDTQSPQATLLELVTGGGLDARPLVDALLARGDAEELVRALSASAGGLAAAETAVLEQRRALVARLRELAATPGTTETQMQTVMGDAYWLFGGRYVGVADRRNLVTLDQHDVPLLGADGTLHIVELKGPHVSRLIRRHRNHLIVGTEVHDAVSQAINYLANVDAQGAALTTVYRDTFGLDLDLHRVFATVVIGHPAHVEGATAKQVEQTLRAYNSHLSRVEVLTWDMLLAAAERALNFERETVATDTGSPDEESPHAGPDSAASPAREVRTDPWARDGKDPWAVPASPVWSDDEPPF